MPGKDIATRQNKFLQKMKKGKVITSPKKTSSNLDKLRKAAETPTRKRLLFSLDATGSREAAWGAATKITKGMFEAVPEQIEVAFAYHGGGALKEITPFAKSARVFLDKLLTVRCEAGGTALNPIMKNTLELPDLKAFVYIGDCFEEDQEEAYALARQLKLKGIKAFFFHDKSSGQQGFDVKTARRVFAGIVDICGGGLFDFDNQAIKFSEELLRAIAVYSVGGRKLLEQKKGTEKAAILLLEQLK